MAKHTLESLEKYLNVARSAFEHGQDMYKHIKSGDHYLYNDVCFREEDMEVLVIYSPLTRPAVRFTRPFTEFREKFVQVPYTRSST